MPAGGSEGRRVGVTGWPILHSDEQPAVDEYCVIAGLENVQITLFRWKHVVYFPVEFETWKLYSYPQKRFVRSPSTAVSWRVRGSGAAADNSVMRQPPPRTAIRTIRQPLTPRYDVASSLDADSFDDDVTSVVRDSPQDVSCDEENDDAIRPARHLVPDQDDEPFPRRKRVHIVDERRDAVRDRRENTRIRDRGRETPTLKEPVTLEEPVKQLKPEWPALAEGSTKEELSPEAEPRRRLASLALASGTGEDVAALAMKGPRPRLRLAIQPFRVLVVFLAVLLIVLWGWLALRIAPSSELASGDGPESSSLTESDKSAGEKLKDDEESAFDGSNPVANGDKDVATEEVSGRLKEGADSTGVSGTVVIYVSGAVQQPGVYTLPASSRVNDAVTAAGGMTENADPAGINLAAQLEDSQHVHIPEPGETPISGSPAGSSGAMETGSGSTNGDSGGPININTAGETELQELPGIGPALSSAIVQWRDEHGSFSSVDDLLDVPGVGPAKLSQLRERATV